MSTYTITAYTVEPTEDGTAYTWDVMGARRSSQTLDVRNLDELRHAMLVVALDHYESDPDNTPAVHVSHKCNGRNVANASRAASLYVKRDALAARSAKRAAAHASLQQSLPIGAE